MKYSFTLSALSAALAVTTVFAAPAQVEKRACSSAVTLSGNPFASRKLYANEFYRKEVVAAAAAISDSALAAKALKVADVGTFKWIDTISVIPTIDAMIKAVPCDQIIGLVIYDLPGRDCAAKASNGELPVGSINRYKTEYIDRMCSSQ
jgi:cellulose 1,4-beta-cellobiosidase